MMKVNVDAAISKNSCIATMAAIARDEGGPFQGASVLVMEGVSSPEIEEAMACREGLALAKDLVLQKVRIATNCANVVTSMQGPRMGPYGHIIREIKAEVASFAEAEVVHESRKSNGEAHNLAKSSVYNSVGRHVCLLSPPDGVCSGHLDI
jgi:ribonuclease HI